MKKLTNTEAERSILALMHNDKRYRDRAAIDMTSDWFQLPQARKLFEATISYRGPDTKTGLTMHLSNLGVDLDFFEMVLFEGVSGAHDEYEFWLSEMRTCYTRRLMVLAFRKVEKQGDELEDSQSIVSCVSQAISSVTSTISNRRQRDDWKALKMDFMADYEQRLSGGALPFVPSGIWSLDSEVNGLPLGKMTVLHGTPGSGKSALAQCIAENLLADQLGVGLFSFEMDANEIIERAVSHGIGEPISKLQTGAVALEAVRNYLDSKKWSLRISSDRQLSAEDLMVQAQIWHSENPLSFIVVDYAQLVATETSRDMSREQALGKVSHALHTISGVTGAAVMVLAQENQDGSTRESKRFEQDAHMILQILKKDDGGRYLRIRKNRNGPTGEVDLNFDGPTTRFS